MTPLTLNPETVRAALSTIAALTLLLLAPSGAVADGPDHASMKAYTETLPGTPVKIEMLPIPVGEDGYPSAVLMGSPDGEANRGEDEGPRLEVEVEAFWMGKCEVTWDTYNVFRREYSIQLDRRLSQDAASVSQWADAVSIPTPLWEQDSAPILEGLGEEGGYPCADISQYAAMQFTKWLSRRTGHFYRLPTEAEWEYAARAGTHTAFFFGDEPAALGDHAWTFDNSAYDDPDKGYPGVGAGYRKVGTKKANPWGLHDIYGNVSEWVLDAYDASAYGRFAGKRVSWQDAVVWPEKIFPCVVRGGNWESDPAGCRSAARLASNRKWQRRDPQIPKSLWWYTDAFHVGFRVIRPLKEPTGQEKLRFWESAAPGVLDVLATGEKQLRVIISTHDTKKKKKKKKEGESPR